MSCRVVFQPSQIEIHVQSGTLLSDAAKSAGVFIDSPCGGNGTCGKCMVLLESDGKQSRVLACQTRVEQGCTVTLEGFGVLNTLHDGAERSVPFAPYPYTPLIEGSCFAAFDLGTTSIVCYLLDGTTGKQLASAGMQNPQSACGADVITRANHVLNGNDNALQTTVVAALNALIARTAAQVGRSPEHLTLVTLVGNTVMHHILLGLPLDKLVRAPYTPFSTKKRIMSASEFGLRTHPDAVFLIAPVIGGFVGADTVACITATAFEQIKRPTLMLDIGTNGELVCTDGTRRVCCSTAAGPAFEGANISCGMRAEAGAVDHVWMEQDAFCFSTIGNESARGICGSGLIDLVALLVRLGTIDETGRFSKDAQLAERLMQTANGLVFQIAQGERTVALSQKDVREVQLGKAAIRAGISVLLDTLALKEAQIERVLLAGAFGSHLSPDALCDIGLLPEVFRGKVESIGNAAGEGAKIYARNFAMFEQSELLASNTEYIELTLSSTFSDYYVDAMAFPEV
ncbi:MAG TPA: ASKHA domain-containing protein [Clostridia bacterium]|nr:ASKHA domain-containing protein [Clostridia bacterium]